MAISGVQQIQTDQPTGIGVTAARRLTLRNTGTVRVYLGSRDPEALFAGFSLRCGETFLHTDGGVLWGICRLGLGEISWIAEE